MKNIFLASILLTSFFIISSCSSSDKEETKNLGVEQDYPDADAVYLKMEKEYTLNENGSVVYRYAHKLKYLTHLSFNRLYGETFVIYEPELQNLKINHSVTTMADGTKVVAPDNAYNEVLPHFAQNFPCFNNLREMVITHTGLEIGATVDLDYELRSKTGFYPYLMGQEAISSSSPVKEMIIRVKVPKNKELFYFLKSDDTSKPSISSEGEYSVYTWVFKNVPAASREKGAGNTKLPVLQFANENMDKATSLVGEKIEYDSNLPEGLKNKVDNIIKQGKKGIALARDLQGLIFKELNQFQVPFFRALFKIRPTADVWKSNGGTNIEMAVILRRILRHAGFEAFITATTKPDLYDHNTGNLFIFDEIMIRVDFEGEQYYLSATYSNNSDYEYYSESTDFVIIDKEDEPVLTDKEIPNNELSVKGELKLLDKSVSGDLEIYFAGTINPYYALLSGDNAANGYLYISGKAKIVENKKPFSKIAFSVDQTLASQDETDYFFFTLPLSNRGVETWGTNILSKDRKSAFELPFLIKETYDYSISIPTDLKLVSNEVNKEIENKLGKVVVKSTMQENGIVVHREINLKVRIIEPVQYNDFKQLMDIWNNPSYRVLVLKKQ